MMGDFHLPSRVAKLLSVQDAIECSLQLLGYTDVELFAIRLALEEAFVLAVRHGSRMDPDGRVHVVFRAAPDRFDVCVTDEGPGFPPTDPDVITDQMLTEWRDRGRLVLESGMRVRFPGRGNITTMVRIRQPGL